MTPEEYCQRKAAGSGSSFYYSFRFLPRERRRAITALYAFCREVDDVVDETADAQLAATKLAWWRQEIALLFEGKPQHPVSRALQPALGPYGITAARLNDSAPRQIGSGICQPNWCVASPSITAYRAGLRNIANAAWRTLARPRAAMYTPMEFASMLSVT